MRIQPPDLNPISTAEHFFDAVGTWDLDSALGLLCKDVCFIPVGYEIASSAGDYSGHGGFTRWWHDEVVSRLDVDVHALRRLDARCVLADVTASKFTESGSLSESLAWALHIDRGAIEAIEVFAKPRRAHVYATAFRVDTMRRSSRHF